MAEPTPVTRVFRLPRTTYLVVVFLLLAAVAIAFGSASGSATNSGAGITWRALVLAVPLLAALYIARTATVVDADGVRIRAAFGSRTLAWDEVRGLSVRRNDVYVVQADGAVRLPCVRVTNLAELARASGGRVPQLRDPTPKYAKAPRRRR